MKKTLRLMMFAFIALSVTFTSCKKSDTTTADNTDLITHSDDQASFDNANDAALNDADAAVESNLQFTGRPQNVLTVPCDATAVFAATATEKTITITYNGGTCPGALHTRTGTIVLSMPLAQHWKDAGAAITATITNLKITRISDNKSITINGVHTITNTSGGLLVNLGLPAATPIIHDISSSNMSVTFDNGTQRTWQVAKRRTFTYSNGIVISSVGTHSDGGITGIAEWGTNRFGNPFVTSTTTPLVIRQDCGFRLVSGEIKHSRLVADVTVTFGLDATGAPTTCPAGVFYYKLVWTGANGIVRTYILPY